MAKTFNQTVKRANKTAYALASQALVLAAALNSVVAFEPMKKAKMANAYRIYRKKNLKAQDAAVGATGTNKFFSEEVIANYDALTKLDWEDIGVATGKKRLIGFTLEKNEEYDVDDLGIDEQATVAENVQNLAVERAEELINEVVTNGTLSTETDPWGTTVNLWEKLATDARKIQFIADEFKHMTDTSKLVIVVHPLVKDALALQIGTAFQNEAPIAQTGLTSKFSINGIPCLEDANLNKTFSLKTGAAGAAEDRQIGYVVLDIESLAFSAQGVNTPFDDTYQDRRFVGIIKYDVQKLVDPKRVLVSPLKKAVIDVTGKVNA